MNLDTKLLVGAWQTEDKDSRAVFVISKVEDNYSVRAFDKVDGEEFIVSKVRLRNGKLLFETRVKSSGYRAKHVLQLLSSRCALQALTLYEQWKKIPLKELKKIEERCAKNRSPLLRKEAPS
jgi:hypothetical protein